VRASPPSRRPRWARRSIAAWASRRRRTTASSCSASDARVAPRARIFHGWLIVATAFVCLAVNVGLMFYAWSVFLTPLAEEFGGRAPGGAGHSFTQAAPPAPRPLVGRGGGHRRARPPPRFGARAQRLRLLLLAHAHSLTALYLCLAGPVALGSTCIGALPNNAAVARWFVVRRGQALGIATAGISAGGIVMAPLAQYLIVRLGWRDAYVVLAALVLVLVLPPVIAFMRRDPADLGLLPDGEPPAGRDRTQASLALVEEEMERSVRPAVAVRQTSFWLLALAFGLTMSGLAGVLLYQIPLLVDRGMPATRAALVLGATAAMGVVGKLGFGALLDRFDPRRVAAVCFCLQAVGVLLLWQARGPLMLACYVVLYGYAMGGNATLQASLVAEAFGRVHFGAIASRLAPFVVAAQALGVPATGYLRD